MNVLFGTGIFVYGHSLDRLGNIKETTRRRVRKAVARQHADGSMMTSIVAAAAFSPDLPAQSSPMHRQIADYAIAIGSYSVCEAPAVTFDTNGEQDVFVSLNFRHEVHITSWWHMPRVIIGRRRRQRSSVVASIVYIPVWDIPPPRSLAFECAKLCTFLLSAATQERLRQFVKSHVRTSW
jgi:hypothetical protein